MASIPLKMSMLQFISSNPGVSVDDILKALEKGYGNERQLNKKNLEHLIGTLKAVGFVEIVDIFAAGDQDIIETYRLSDGGKDALKYIPANVRES